MSTKIPIFLTNRDTLQDLKIMIESIRRFGDIYIIDNDSKYPPLLDWYSSIDIEVVFMDHNRWGKWALWKSGLINNFKHQFYITSDADLDLSECPGDLVEAMKDGLNQYREIDKVGVSLRIDDLPPDGILTVAVLEWERRFWNASCGNFFDANIDTTFAMRRPWTKRKKFCERKRSLRTKPPYTARHLPWYTTSDNITDEDRFRWSRNSTSGHWRRRLIEEYRKELKQ